MIQNFTEIFFSEPRKFHDREKLGVGTPVQPIPHEKLDKKLTFDEFSKL